jgi:hypothetical protein
VPWRSEHPLLTGHTRNVPFGTKYAGLPVACKIEYSIFCKYNSQVRIVFRKKVNFILLKCIILTPSYLNFFSFGIYDKTFRVLRMEVVFLQAQVCRKQIT